jgi:hypothetical protein
MPVQFSSPDSSEYKDQQHADQTLENWAAVGESCSAMTKSTKRSVPLETVHYTSSLVFRDYIVVGD